MDIVFYKTRDVENKIVKTLSDDVLLNGTLKNECNIVSMSILLQGVSIVFDYNYCYIPKLKRYYFVKDFSVKRNGLVEVDILLDVLMSYQDSVMSGNYHVIEQDRINENYSKISLNEKENIKHYQYELPFSEDNNILITRRK